MVFINSKLHIQAGTALAITKGKQFRRNIVSRRSLYLALAAILFLLEFQHSMVH